MITAQLIGDEAVLSGLRALPDAVNSGVARAVTKLGIDLLRNVQASGVTGPSIAGRLLAGGSNYDLLIDQNAEGASAIVFSTIASNGEQSSLVGTRGPKNDLRQVKRALGRQISQKTHRLGTRRRRIDLPNTSFLRRAVEEMSPNITDEVEAAVREAVDA